MPALTVNNVLFYHEEHGSGDETVVFGHSMLFNLRMFDQQVEALKSGFSCVLFDFRGQGKSEVTADGYDLDTLTEDVAELIVKFGCSPCHFVGFSMGGMVAMRLAARRPDLIRSLVLIDTSPEPDPSPDSLRNRAMLWTAKNLGLKPIAGQVISMFFGPAFVKDPTRKELRKIWKNHFLDNDRMGIIKVVRGVLERKGITSEFEHIDKPTLIIWGDDNYLTYLLYAGGEILEKLDRRR